jgi:hypothetical protein
MKRLLLVAVAGVTLGAGAVPKNRAAVMYYTGSDSVISLVASADSANIALLLTTGLEGDSIPSARLGGRPCLGVALFSRAEWAGYAADGRRPEDLKPRDAALRIRIYGPSASEPITVQNVVTGKAHHGIGLDLPALQKAAKSDKPAPMVEQFAAAVANRMGTLRGACSVQ